MNGLTIKKSIYLLIVIMLIPIVIIQVIGIKGHYKSSIRQVLQANEDFAKATSTAFSNFVQRTWDTELAIGLAISNGMYNEPDRIGMYLNEVFVNQKAIGDYAWIGIDGKIIAGSDNKLVGKYVGDKETFKSILKGKDMVVSDLVMSDTYKRPSIIIARAIKDNGKLKGILSACIDVSKLGSIFPKERVIPASSFGMVDRNGTLIFSETNPYIAKQALKLSADSPVFTALKGRIKRSERFISPINGEVLIGVGVPVQELGWATCANVSYDYVLRKVKKHILRDAVMLMITIAIYLLLAFIISKKILRPIKMLQNIANEISKGNYGVRTNIKGSNELAETAKAFDHMAKSIDEYDKLKSQFISNISHELKTPLNIILSSTQMLYSLHDPVKDCPHYLNVEKYIKMMRQNCYRLLRLINNLIDITRIDAGFIKLNLREHNIVGIVEDITLSVVKYAEMKDIELIFDTDIEEKQIVCDPDKIERIILNILSNAIKFTRPGGIIRVTVWDKGDSLIVSVKDNGIGVPADKLNIIFERFRQVDSDLNREYEGSGIGLSLVKALVEAHGGTIEVISELGQGTEFIMNIPVKVMKFEADKSDYTVIKGNIDKVQRINIEFSDIYPSV